MSRYDMRLRPAKEKATARASKKVKPSNSAITTQNAFKSNNNTVVEQGTPRTSSTLVGVLITNTIRDPTSESLFVQSVIEYLQNGTIRATRAKSLDLVDDTQAQASVVRSRAMSLPIHLDFDLQAKDLSKCSPNQELENVVPIMGAVVASTEVAPTTAKKTRVVRPRGTPRGFGYSPWPDYDRPNPEECAEVHRLLTEAHGESVRPDVLIVDNDVPGCGEVPCVLDALLRTVIALNTTTKNSGVAFKGLIDRFGIIEAEEDSSSNTKRRIYSEGAVGSVDWDGVRRASLKDVAESIQGAGLQVLKAKTMKGILDAVWEEGKLRRRKARMEEALSKAAVGVDDDSDLSDIEEEDDDGELSLEHLRALDDKDVMKALTSYFGIGPKAAACVMLFALGRNLFPVDTHVYRLSKFLGWVPEDVKNENDAFYHLDLKIPNKYKYGLHNLLIRHGRSCKHCKAGPSSPLKEGDVTKQPAQPRLDENGQVIMKQRLVPRWEGNGLMKEVMVPMMVPDGVELDDSCIIEHLVSRGDKRRKPQKRKTDTAEGDEANPADGSPTPKGRKPRAKKDKVASEVKTNDEAAPKAKRQRVTKVEVKMESEDKVEIGIEMLTASKPKRQQATEAKMQPIFDDNLRAGVLAGITDKLNLDKNYEISDCVESDPEYLPVKPSRKNARKKAEKVKAPAKSSK